VATLGAPVLDVSASLRPAPCTIGPAPACDDRPAHARRGKACCAGLLLALPPRRGAADHCGREGGGGPRSRRRALHCFLDSDALARS
jgi:hypothetical protein